MGDDPFSIFLDNPFLELKMPKNAPKIAFLACFGISKRGDQCYASFGSKKPSFNAQKRKKTNLHFLPICKGRNDFTTQK